jgi:hypothetical protein
MIFSSFCFLLSTLFYFFNKKFNFFSTFELLLLLLLFGSAIHRNNLFFLSKCLPKVGPEVHCGQWIHASQDSRWKIDVQDCSTWMYR